MTERLLQQEPDTTGYDFLLGDEGEDDSGSDVPPAGQQSNEDYEKRFKGLQREYEKVQKTLRGKEDYAKQVQQEKNSLEQQIRDLERERQGEITRLSTELETFKTGQTTLEQQLNQLKAEKVAMEREREIRKTLLAPNDKGERPYADLLPWLDSGYLQPGDRTGDELTQFLDGFRTLMGVQQQPAKRDFRGSSPPALSTQGVSHTQMSRDELANYLETHDDSDPQYMTYFNQWLASEAERATKRA